MSANLQRWLCTVPEDYFPESVWGAFDAIVGRVAWTDSSPILRGDVLRPSDVGGVLVWPLDQVDAEFLAAAPRLRVISTIGTGVDHIDLAAATARGIPVCHTPGLNKTPWPTTPSPSCWPWRGGWPSRVALVRAVAGGPPAGGLRPRADGLDPRPGRPGGHRGGGGAAGRGFGMRVLYASRSRKTGPGDGVGLEWMASTTSCDRRTSCRCTRRSPRRRAA